MLWELAGAGEDRQHRALRLIAAAFLALAVYLGVQTIIVLAIGERPQHSTPASPGPRSPRRHVRPRRGKHRIGRALGNPVLLAEGRVTVIDGLLASAVLVGLVLNAAAGWWWADPAAGLVIVYYALKEARSIHQAAAQLNRL